MPNIETTTLLHETMHELEAYADAAEARAWLTVLRQVLDLDDP